MQDLASAGVLLREWAEGDDPDGDPTGIIVAAKVYEMLAAVDTTRQPKV